MMRSVFVILVCLYSYVASPVTHAEVVTDGTMGAAMAFPGPDFDIPQSIGTTVGNNLFHSFDSFNLASTESATFSGAASLENVISRVTGGNPSNIDGLLRLTIPDVGFFFINPAGVILGPNAQVDIDGSFAVSTADFLSLADGGHFDAANPSNDSLTIAPPSAFGFVNSDPASITLSGATIEVNPGETLAMAGGDVTLDGSTLIAPNGTLQVVAVDSEGELPVDSLSTAFFSSLGDISLANSSMVNGSTSGPGAAGEVHLVADQIWIDNSFEFAYGFSATDGDVINDGLISMQDGATDDLLTVTGEYTATTGTLSIDTVLNDGVVDITDKLVINGNSSGTTIVNIDNVGGTGSLTGSGPTDGILVIEVSGTSAGLFVVAGGGVTDGEGSFLYNLYQADGQNWYLQSLQHPIPVVPGATVVPIPALFLIPLMLVMTFVGVRYSLKYKNART